MTDLQKLLTAAKNHIKDPKMWKKGGSETKDILAGCPVCALDAVYWAVKQIDYHIISMEAHLPLRSAVRTKTGNTYVAWFNDLTSTAHQDIMALFDEAILIAGD